MPKETFFNLPEVKRSHILTTAIQEFYSFGYEGFSISRLVENASIAKGSFYQYFEGKDDLYAHIISVAGERKLAYLVQIQESFETLPFFSLLRHLYLGSLSFLREEPQLATITDRFLKNADSVFKEKILGANVKKSNEFVKQCIKASVIKGQLRDDLDISYIASMITVFSIALGDYVRSTVNEVKDIRIEDYEKLVDNTISIMQRGLQSQP